MSFTDGTNSTGTDTDTDNRVRNTADNIRHEESRRISTETKSSYKTTELIAFVVAVIAVLIASAVADKDTDFGAKTAFLYITALTIGYMLSRGLAKSGSREPFDADTNHSNR